MMNKTIDKKINTALIKLQARQKSEKMLETMLGLGLTWTKAEQQKFIEDEIYNRLNQDEMLKELMSYRLDEMERETEEDYDNDLWI